MLVPESVKLKGARGLSVSEAWGLPTGRVVNSKITLVVILFVLILDMAKSIIPVVILNQINYFDSNGSIQFFALLFVIGHCYPIYNKFKGGKGVATGPASKHGRWRWRLRRRWRHRRRRHDDDDATMENFKKIGRVDAIKLVQKSSKSETSSRFFRRLKILTPLSK